MHDLSIFIFLPIVRDRYCRSIRGFLEELWEWNREKTKTNNAGIFNSYERPCSEKGKNTVYGRRLAMHVVNPSFLRCNRYRITAIHYSVSKVRLPALERFTISSTEASFSRSQILKKLGKSSWRESFPFRVSTFSRFSMRLLYLRLAKKVVIRFPLLLQDLHLDSSTPSSKDFAR